MKMAVFWVFAAASTSETSINFYQTARRNNSQQSHLQSHYSFLDTEIGLFSRQSKRSESQQVKTSCFIVSEWFAFPFWVILRVI
jgi:hypothetical protein